MNNKVRTAIMMWTLGLLIPSAAYSQQQQQIGGQGVNQQILGQGVNQQNPGLGNVPQAGIAAENSSGWNIIPYVSLTETYTDDVDLDSNVKESDFITQVEIGTAIQRTGPRFNLALDYGLTYFYYPGLDGDKDEFRHNLLANSQTELVNELLYFDFNAGVTQTYIDPRDAFSTADSARTENRATIGIINASPYILRKIGGNFATVETRYEYTYIDSSQFANFNGLNLGNTQNTQFHEGSINFSSGSRFTRFTWGWESLYRQETSTNADNNNIYSSIVLGEYQVNRYFALLGEAGYTEREANFFGGRFSGLVWRAGARLTPGPRTVIEATYGEEFFGRTVYVEASYNVTENITITANYDDRFDTFRALFIDDFLNGPANGIDPVLNPLAVDFVRFRTATATISGVRGRSRFTLIADYSKTNANDNQQLLDTKRKSLSLNWTRQLAPRLSFSATALVFEEEFELQPQNDLFISFEGRFDYLLSENITGSIEYIHTNRKQRFFNFQQRGSNYVSLILGATF